MLISIFLAKLMGIILMIASFGILVNQKYYYESWSNLSKEPILLTFVGMIRMMLGLLIILIHNVWTLDWKIIITLLGWITFIRGVLLILRPESVQKINAKILEEQNLKYLNGMLTIFFVIGAFLTYKGYFQ